MVHLHFPQVDQALLEGVLDVGGLRSVRSERACIATHGLLLAIVYQRRPADLVRFVDDVVKNLPGVLDVRTEPILDLVKNDARWGLVRSRER
jgi:hypothetical protein